MSLQSRLSDLISSIGADVKAINTALNSKAPTASPALTGNPTAPTPTAGDNDTSIATTAFVQTAISGKLPYIEITGGGAVPGGTPAGTYIFRY